MDGYTISRLYHNALVAWWSLIRDHPPLFRIQDIPIESLFLLLFKQFPLTSIILLASDGKIGSVSTMDEPAPESFRLRRYMKIDNRTSISSLKNVISVLYQLLSISVDEEVSWIDGIGLTKFIMMIQCENCHIDWSLTECCLAMRRQLFHGPDVLGSEEKEVWKKEIRDPLLHAFYDRDQERSMLQQHEMVQQQVKDAQALIQRLLQIIDLHTERMDHMEECLSKIMS